jgi:hypothetical protein
MRVRAMADPTAADLRAATTLDANVVTMQPPVIDGNARLIEGQFESPFERLILKGSLPPESHTAHFQVVAPLAGAPPPVGIAIHFAGYVLVVVCA